MAKSRDRVFLARAAELAAAGVLAVEPNPPVGCVLARGDRVVGEGWHRAWGGPHAEVEALRRAGRRARGATAYVTLEPCGHHGKTPPCADALIAAGVAEVVYATADPHPVTAGRGPALLHAAGVRVRRAAAPAALDELLRPYLEHIGRGRPWVIAKWAASLDGRIATRSGDARWISSEASRDHAHRTWRARVDAILVGAGTVRADDPRLTNRSGRGGIPLRVVLCGKRPIPRRSRLLRDGGPTLLAVSRGYRVPPGAEALVCGRNGRVDPEWLLRALHERGVRRLLAEGGGKTLGALFDAGLVDQVAAFIAPRILGGNGARAPVLGRGAARAGSAIRLNPVRWRRIGGDLLVEGLVSRRSRAAGRS